MAKYKFQYLGIIISNYLIYIKLSKSNMDY